MWVDGSLCKYPNALPRMPAYDFSGRANEAPCPSCRKMQSVTPTYLANGANAIPHICCRCHATFVVRLNVDMAGRTVKYAGAAKGAAAAQGRPRDPESFRAPLLLLGFLADEADGYVAMFALASESWGFATREQRSTGTARLRVPPAAA